MSKYLLVLLNFLTVLMGMGVLAVGIYSTTLGGQVRHLLSLGMPISVVVLGAAIIATALFGVYAAFTENAMHLRLYFGILSVLLLLQIVSSSLAMARRQDVDLKLYDAWERAQYRDRDLLKKLEKTYGCCGFATVHDRAVPDDCAETKEFGFKRPCRFALGRELKRTLRNVGLGGIIFGALIGLALLFTLGLYSDIITGERDVHGLAESRRLLREGRLESHQGAKA